MAKSNATYWKERFEALEDTQYRKSKEYYQDVEKQFRMATNNVQMDIEKWYARLAENNNISYAAAKRLLKKKELEEFHWTLEEYIKKGQENAVNQRWMKELENASARVHIERLEAMKIQMQQHAEILSAQYLNGTTEFLRNTYADNFYRTAYEIQKGIGIGSNLTRLDTRTIDKIIQQPWASDGANFSDRIWSNKDKLVRNLHTELTQSIIRGENPSKAAERLAKIMGVSKAQAANLVYTESAAISASAKQDCFNELGVEEFEIVETLDSKTCSLCQSMDGTHMPMKYYQVGVTVPPLHPRCRGTTCPYFDDEFTEGDMRVARGEDGKTYYVPADMKYQEWKEKYVHEKGHNSVLTLGETGAIIKYISPDAYVLNDKLRRKEELTKTEKEWIINLDRALEKLPYYEGDLNRSLTFYSSQDAKQFYDSFVIGNNYIPKQYLSATKQGVYNERGQVQIYIQNAKNGKDLAKLNDMEHEVLYPIGSKFEVVNKVEEQGTYFILLKEVL